MFSLDSPRLGHQNTVTKDPTKNQHYKQKTKEIP